MTTPSPITVAAHAQALADRLRALPESRWLRAEEGGSVAERGLEIARLLAELTAPASAGPVPDLGPFAVPDQLAVTAGDLAETSSTALDPAALRVVAERIAQLAESVPNAMTPPP